MMRIEELEDEVYGLACAVGSLQAEVAELRKGIVRCRDCKWCMAYSNAAYCDRFAHALPTSGGFCAWGRKVDG